MSRMSGGGGGRKLIHTENIGSTVASVQFAIPNFANHKKLRFEWDLFHVAGGTYVDLYMKLMLNSTLYGADYVSTAQTFWGASSQAGVDNTSKIQLSTAISEIDTEQSGYITMSNNMSAFKRKGYGRYVGDKGNSLVTGVNGFMQDGADATDAIEEVEFSCSQNFTAGGEIRVYAENS